MVPDGCDPEWPWPESSAGTMHLLLSLFLVFSHTPPSLVTMYLIPLYLPKPLDLVAQTYASTSTRAPTGTQT